MGPSENGFWTWKDFFLRWLGSAASHPASRETAGHLFSQEGQQESKLACFLSSLPEDGRGCHNLKFDGDLEVRIDFGRGFEFTLFHGTGVDASYHEFLEAVASAEIEFCEGVIISLEGDESCKHMEAFIDALRQSSNSFRELDFRCSTGSAIQFANCVSSVLLKNNAIQGLNLEFCNLKEKMDKELVTEFMAIIAIPHNLQILKNLRMKVLKLDGEGMMQLMKPFKDPLNVLEDLACLHLTSDTQLEHISDMLASSTSLKRLHISQGSTKVQKAFTRGYSSLAAALCSNQSLKQLTCYIFSSIELKVLLDPLVSKNNSLQRNNTLINLQFCGSNIGGKEGIETLVDLIHTNMSLLQLAFQGVHELSLHDGQATKNVLALLKALKTNKSLKSICFSHGCDAVKKYKVLGAMMDLLLENHNIQDIDLYSTGLEESGDADFVSFALSKKKKMKLWDVVQSMAIVNPKSGRVFLCGQPHAGKTRLQMSMKQLDEFQPKDEIPNQLWNRGKIRNIFKTFHTPKVPTEDKPLERTHGIEVESVQCDGIGITIWDMAGQTNYHSFHELVMPNLLADGSSSMFLLMCNPMKQSNPCKRRCPSEIKLELESWLRFIASNTRRSLSYRPHVSIVLTHFDYWMDDHSFADPIVDEVEQLKSQFQEVLEFDEDQSTFKVDGRSVSCAREVFDFMKFYMKRLLQRLPKTIKACEDVQRLVALWNVDKSKQLLLKWEEFCEGLCKEVEELNDVDHELAKRKREFVAISFNDGGYIIYNEKEGVVITNPHWFCHQIVGQFLHQCAIVDCELEIVSANGIISMKHMKRLILKLVEGQENMEKKFDDILDTMMKLHICYEQDASSIMIPSTLKDKHKSLSWSTNDDSTSFKYVGRRLACVDGIQTMLTPRFFTRLHVLFLNNLV